MADIRGAASAASECVMVCSRCGARYDRAPGVCCPRCGNFFAGCAECQGCGSAHPDSLKRVRSLLRRIWITR